MPAGAAATNNSPQFNAYRRLSLPHNPEAGIVYSISRFRRIHQKPPVTVVIQLSHTIRAPTTFLCKTSSCIAREYVLTYLFKWEKHRFRGAITIKIRKLERRLILSCPCKYMYGIRRNVIFTLLFVLLTAFTPLIAEAMTAQASQGDNSMTLVYPTGNAPWFFLNSEGVPQGILVDYWKLWSQKNGIKVDFLPRRWNTALDAIRNGEADALAGTITSSVQAEYYAFSRPIMPVKVSVFVSNKFSANSMVELKGLEVGVLEGGKAEAILDDEYKFIKLRRFKTNEELFKAMTMGNVPAFVSERSLARHYLAKAGLLGDYKVLSELYNGDICTAVPKERPEILELINHGMAQINEAELAALQEKWDIPASTFPNITRKKTMYRAGGAVAAFFLLNVLIFSLQVRRRTRKLKSSLELIKHQKDCLEREVAEKRRIEEEYKIRESRYRKLAECSVDMIGMLDHSGIVTYANKPFLDMLKYRKWDVIGKHCRKFLPAISLRNVNQFLDKPSYQRTDASTCRLDVYTSDEKVVGLDLTISTINEGIELKSLIFIARKSDCGCISDGSHKNDAGVSGSIEDSILT